MVVSSLLCFEHTAGFNFKIISHQRKVNLNTQVDGDQVMAGLQVNNHDQGSKF
jgi:hypothetical protein